MERDTERKILSLLILASAGVILLSLFMALQWAPTPKESSGLSAPQAQRIFYLHLPLALNAYIAFSVVFISSILFLRKSDQRWDRLAAASAEVGLLFSTLVLFSGSLWGKAEWGVYWRWGDMRLVTFLILWLVLAAYIVLRGSIESRERMPRLAAVFGIMGYITVPLSYLSMFVWRTYHPNVVSPGGGGINSDMLITLLVSLAGFLIFLITLIWIRKQQLEAQERVEDLRNQILGGFQNG